MTASLLRLTVGSTLRSSTCRGERFSFKVAAKFCIDSEDKVWQNGQGLEGPGPTTDLQPLALIRNILSKLAVSGQLLCELRRHQGNNAV